MSKSQATLRLERERREQQQRERVLAAARERFAMLVERHRLLERETNVTNAVYKTAVGRVDESLVRRVPDDIAGLNQRIAELSAALNAAESALIADRQKANQAKLIRVLPTISVPEPEADHTTQSKNIVVDEKITKKLTDLSDRFVKLETAQDLVDSFGVQLQAVLDSTTDSQVQNGLLKLQSMVKQTEQTDRQLKANLANLRALEVLFAPFEDDPEVEDVLLAAQAFQYSPDQPPDDMFAPDKMQQLADAAQLRQLQQWEQGQVATALASALAEDGCVLEDSFVADLLSGGATVGLGDPVGAGVAFHLTGSGLLSYQPVAEKEVPVPKAVEQEICDSVGALGERLSTKGVEFSVVRSFPAVEFPLERVLEGSVPRRAVEPRAVKRQRAIEQEREQ